MAITPGNTYQASSANNVSSLSWTHTTASGDNLLVVGVVMNDSSTSDATISGIIHNGDAMTKATNIHNPTTGFGAEIWYRINPDIGSGLTIAVTFGGKCSDVWGASQSYSGCNASDPLDTASSTASSVSGAAASRTINPATVNSIIVGICIAGTGTAGNVSVTSPGTELQENDMGSQIGSFARNAESGGSATIAWTFADTYYSACAAATFNPATKMQVNIGDSFKAVTQIKINIGDSWKGVKSAKVNIGDAWKTIF